MRLLLNLLMVMASGSALAGTAPPPADLRAMVAEHGARYVVDELVRQDRWDAVSRHIATGQADWLLLVPMLATGTDAGPSEDLGVDLAFALPKNPQAVLTVANEKKWAEGGIIGIQRVCGVPFVETTEPRKYLRDTTRAVQGVTDPELANKRRQCLEALVHSGANSQ